MNIIIPHDPSKDPKPIGMYSEYQVLSSFVTTYHVLILTACSHPAQYAEGNHECFYLMQKPIILLNSNINRRTSISSHMLAGLHPLYPCRGVVYISLPDTLPRIVLDERSQKVVTKIVLERIIKA